MTAQDTDDKESVLFVDDERHILSSIRRLVRPLGLQTYFANSGAEGLEILEQNHVDLVVSDMRMPEMDGAAFLTEVKQRWPDTVRMLLTGYADISSTIEALNNGGIYRYISKPWDDDELKEIVLNGVKMRRLERETRALTELTQKQNAELLDLNKNLEAKVEARTEEIRQTAEMLDLAFQQLQGSYEAFVKVFASFISYRKTIRGESRMVADFSRKIAKALKLEKAEIKSIFFAALLHELGKLSMPDEILRTAEENLPEKAARRYYKYPLMGEVALSAVDELEASAKIIRAHGELLDGSGFPDGIKGDSIPVGAKIIRAVRDFIGLQTGMICDPPMELDDALAEIKKGVKTRYDAQVVYWIEQFKDDAKAISEKELAHEMKVELHGLVPGMRLTRDLFNNQGMLLIAKGHVLTPTVISTLASMKKVEQEKYIVYIDKKSIPRKSASSEEAKS